MKALIIKIGNSHGIRIPKPIIAQCGFEEEVEFSVQNNALIIKSLKFSRKNWDAAFKKMAAQPIRCWLADLASARSARLHQRSTGNKGIFLASIAISATQPRCPLQGAVVTGECCIRTKQPGHGPGNSDDRCFYRAH